MAFTLICYVCRHKLKLFDSSIKKRKGTIRCPYCSARISYDLDSRKIQKSGFWATEEPAFDPQTKDKMLNQLEGDKNRKSPDSENFLVLQKQTPFGKNPFQASAGFTGFDLKSGQIGKNRQNYLCLPPKQNIPFSSECLPLCIVKKRFIQLPENRCRRNLFFPSLGLSRCFTKSKTFFINNFQ